MDKNQSQFIEQIRLNVAFEQLVVSVLLGAAIGAAIVFLSGLADVFAAGAFSIVGLVLRTFAAGFLIFLIGFFSGIIVITPLFRMLEKAKRRTVWPYAAAGFGIAVIALIAMTQMPPAGGPGPAMIIAVLSASLISSLDFGRRMKPFWRAAERAEMEASADVFRLN